MKHNSLLYRCLSLFLTFMKVGAFTFGGGYAMIPIIEEEVSRKRKWITEMEIIDVLAISESTPGPIAINTATYVGYKVAGIWGSLAATFGLIIPSFVIIFIISFFYDKFMAWPPIQAIFKGLKVGVILLLVNATIKLGKNIKINTLSIILFVIALSVSLVFTFIDTGFKYVSLSLILFGLITGVVLTLIANKKGEKK